MQSASGRLTTGPTGGDKHPETPFESAARPRACGFDVGLRHSEATSVWRALMCEVEPVQARPHRISWARLLERVFDIDMQHCPNCGAGELKIIAAILERPVIEKVLSHLVLDPQPPPKGRACGAAHE